MNTDSEEYKYVSSAAVLIKEKFKAKDVILFGSYAYGTQNQDSDIDLMVVLETDMKPQKQAALIRMFLNEVLGVGYPVDLMVRTPEQINNRIKMGDFFIKRIMSDGVMF